MAALVTVATLLVPAVPAAAKTTVKVDGDDVTITVPIDCVGCKDWVAPTDGSPLATYWEKTAEAAWNAAFDKYPFCSKYKFKLDIKMKNVAEGAASDFGSHRLVATAPDGLGFTGAGWGGAPEGTPGGPADQRSTDGTRYFEFDAEGTMPADATPTVIAHEFGHVIGLGDDRDASGNTLPGRGKTLMVGGANGVTPNTKLRIDKALVDRLGNQLANLGKINCGVAWNGTVRSTFTDAYGCTGTDEGTITVRVVDKKASGTVAVSGAFTCVTELVTITASGSVTVGVFGKFTGEEFRFYYEPNVVVTGDGPTDNCSSGPERPIVIPVTERGLATASLSGPLRAGR